MGPLPHSGVRVVVPDRGRRPGPTRLVPEGPHWSDPPPPPSSRSARDAWGTPRDPHPKTQPRNGRIPHKDREPRGCSRTPTPVTSVALRLVASERQVKAETRRLPFGPRPSKLSTVTCQGSPPCHRRPLNPCPGRFWNIRPPLPVRSREDQFPLHLGLPLP